MQDCLSMKIAGSPSPPTHLATHTYTYTYTHTCHHTRAASHVHVFFRPSWQQESATSAYQGICNVLPVRRCSHLREVQATALRRARHMPQRTTSVGWGASLCHATRLVPCTAHISTTYGSTQSESEPASQPCCTCTSTKETHLSAVMVYASATHAQNAAAFGCSSPSTVMKTSSSSPHASPRT